MTNKQRLSALMTASVLAMVISSDAFANDWEGFSLGIGGGYGMANNELKIGQGPEVSGVGSGLDINGLGGTGGFFTLGVGYDRAIYGPLILGAFVDYDFADIETKASLGIPPLGNLNASATFKINNQLSVGARFGYLVSPTTLFFTTAGYSHVDTSDVDASVSTDFGGGGGKLASVGGFNGYFFGGGAETSIGNGFSVKAEYRYTSLQAEDVTLLPGSGISDVLSASIKPQIQTMRLSLNYRFGDGKQDALEPPPPPTTNNWTGAYIGIGTGYSIANNKATLSDRSTPPGSLFNIVIDGIGSDGGFISGTAGYDYQLSRRIVAGAFVDGDLSNLHHSNKIELSAGSETLGVGTHSEFNDILMIGGRLGYLMTPDTLLFASAGYANAGMDDTNLGIGIAGTGGSTTLIDGKRFDGAFVGGGVETKISNSLSLKAEYRYVDLGRETMTLLPNDLPEINQIISTTFDPAIQMGRVSLNYRFGSPLEEAAPPLK